MSEQQQTIEYGHDTWGIFEAAGHVKRAGKVRTTSFNGAAIFIVETPYLDEDGTEKFLREDYNATFLYRFTATTEDAARLVGKTCNPSPVQLLGIPYRVQMAMARIDREEAEKAAATEAGETPREVADTDGVPFDPIARQFEDDFEDWQR